MTQNAKMRHSPQRLDAPALQVCSCTIPVGSTIGYHSYS